MEFRRWPFRSRGRLACVSWRTPIRPCVPGCRFRAVHHGTVAALNHHFRSDSSPTAIIAGLHAPQPPMSTPASPASNPRVGFVSLGCPKALVDSERNLTQLQVEGYDIVQPYADADVVVVNTCGFLDSAVAASPDPNGGARQTGGGGDRGGER